LLEEVPIKGSYKRDKHSFQRLNRKVTACRRKYCFQFLFCFTAYNLPRFFEISREEILLPDSLHTVHDVVPTSLRQNSNYIQVSNILRS
jgi:hypothetical protein